MKLTVQSLGSNHGDLISFSSFFWPQFFPASLSASVPALGTCVEAELQALFPVKGSGSATTPALGAVCATQSGARRLPLNPVCSSLVQFFVAVRPRSDCVFLCLVRQSQRRNGRQVLALRCFRFQVCCALLISSAGLAPWPSDVGHKCS